MASGKTTGMIHSPTGQASPWRRVSGEKAELVLWRLPAPERVFYAHVAEAREELGEPVLVFAQLADGKPTAAYRVQLPAGRIGALARSFRPIRERMAQGDTLILDVARPSIVIGDVSPSRSLVHTATVIRAAANPDHVFFDFFRVEPTPGEAFKERNAKVPDVAPLARVWLTPTMVVNLIDDMNRLGWPDRGTDDL